MGCINFGYEEKPCTDKSGHKWLVTEKPGGSRSGWHEKVCEICGEELSWDSSD